MAEAFAACRSVTVPTQLRSLIRADGRDLAGQFRQLAPKRRPSRSSSGISAGSRSRPGLLAALAAAVALFAGYLKVAGLL